MKTITLNTASGSNSAPKQQPLSAEAIKSIKAFFADFCEYMVFNYEAEYTSDFHLDWNCVGATARFMGNGRNVQLRLWERSEGHQGIPDMTVIIYDLDLRGSDNPDEEQKALINWLCTTAKANGFRHLAWLGRKPLENKAQVSSCEIACITL